jgi:hypothetical protein
LISLEKWVVHWSESKNGWCYSSLSDIDTQFPLLDRDALGMKRFCSYFELQ